MRDPSRIPTHHGVFHFREARLYVCASYTHTHTHTLALKSPRTLAAGRVCAFKYVCLDCVRETARREARPRARARGSLQRVVQILSDRRTRPYPSNDGLVSRVCARARAKRFISRLSDVDTTVAEILLDRTRRAISYYIYI